VPDADLRASPSATLWKQVSGAGESEYRAAEALAECIFEGRQDELPTFSVRPATLRK